MSARVDLAPVAGPRAPRVRPAERADLAPIMEIERACFLTPWPAKSMADELDGRPWSRVAVAEVGDRVAGFMVYWSVTPELHLLNLATLPELRRRGVARALVRHLCAAARRGGASEIVLEVRESNAPARALYRGFGFEPIGVRPGYYADTREDAVVMQLLLDPAGAGGRLAPGDE